MFRETGFLDIELHVKKCRVKKEQVRDEKARAWYEKEAIEQTWSVRTLQRNISSQYYYRMIQTQQKELVVYLRKKS